MVYPPTARSVSATADEGVSHVPHATAIELGNGRSVPIELRHAVRGFADALRRAMRP
jgi:hypothetical protein